MREIADWTEVDLEPVRKMMFKSNPGVYVYFYNVTHIKKRTNGTMIRCDQGVVYFQNDDVSHIVSECEDWVV